jgi:hypothetical protein
MTEEMKTMLKAMKAHPKLVKPVHWLESDVAALFLLTRAVEAPVRQIRMARQMKVIYGFGDASGNGFGSSIHLPSVEVVWRSGMWNRTMVEEHNSNFFELANLIMALEDLQVKGGLVGHEIFMFTDNTTAEAAHFNGTTKHGKQLFDLMLRLRKLEMNGECQVHLIHVAGTRMIWQGSDALSRGDENAGIMAGEDMLSFVPLHKQAIDRSENLLSQKRSFELSVESFDIYC